MKEILKLKRLKPVPLLIIIGLFVVGNVLMIAKITNRQSCQDNSHFINPHFACGSEAMVVDKKEYSELRAKIKSYTDEQKKIGKATTIGVWFRDLEGGPTFGVNERMDFIPASLLKLPLALTFLQLAEDDPDLLGRTTEWEDSTAPVPKQVFLPEDPIVKNRTYTIDQLITHTMLHSDNVAAQLLFDYLNNNYKDHPLSQTYRDLGIIDPGVDFNMTAVNTKEYASIFRMLYNVSFLDKKDSEKILSLLAKSDFRNGLRKGLPGNITVADKFGERFLENGEKQLHDCGIVYYPDNPYELCIMTRGHNYDDLSDIIGEISRQVYLEFDSRKL